MIALFNSSAQIDLSVIDPAEVAKLDDNQQIKLASLISAVQAREAAQVRFTSAVVAVGEASQEQVSAMEAHIAASDPFPFVPHPDIAGSPTEQSGKRHCAQRASSTRVASAHIAKVKRADTSSDFDESDEAPREFDEGASEMVAKGKLSPAQAADDAE
jgi:hypothetical protein